MYRNLSSYDGTRTPDSGNFFEWWYFDLELRNRYHVHVEWHSPIFYFKDAFNTLVVRIHKYNNMLGNSKGMNNKYQPVKAFHYHRSSVFQSEKKCEIIFPSGYIKEENGKYFINVLEKGLRIDLELSRLLPPLSIENDKLYQTKNEREYLGWCVTLPKAAATGKIEIDGNPIEVKGLCYHDHNWGNLNFKKKLQGWVRVFFRDFSVIFGDITSNKPKEKGQVLLFVDREGHAVNVESLKINYYKFDNQNQYNIRIPRSFFIEFTIKDSYRIVFQRNQNAIVAEAPLFSFDSNFPNLLLVRFFYFFQLHHAPNLIRKWLGRFLYFQSDVTAELFRNDQFIDRKIGNVEVISFAD